MDLVMDDGFSSFFLFLLSHSSPSSLYCYTVVIVANLFNFYFLFSWAKQTSRFNCWAGQFKTTIVCQEHSHVQNSFFLFFFLDHLLITSHNFTPISISTSDLSCQLPKPILFFLFFIYHLLSSSTHKHKHTKKSVKWTLFPNYHFLSISWPTHKAAESKSAVQSVLQYLLCFKHCTLYKR